MKNIELDLQVGVDPNTKCFPIIKGNNINLEDEFPFENIDLDYMKNNIELFKFK